MCQEGEACKFKPAVQEEIFGPVVGEPDVAVEMANDSKYGLSGHVDNKGRVRALEVGSAIRSGRPHH